MDGILLSTFSLFRQFFEKIAKNSHCFDKRDERGGTIFWVGLRGHSSIYIGNRVLVFIDFLANHLAYEKCRESNSRFFLHNFSIKPFYYMNYYYQYLSLRKKLTCNIKKPQNQTISISKTKF